MYNIQETSEKSNNKEEIIKEILSQSHKQYHLIYQTWRSYDLITSIFSTIGLILSIILYEIEISNYYTIDIIKNPDANFHPKN